MLPLSRKLGDTDRLLIFAFADESILPLVKTQVDSQIKGMLRAPTRDPQ